jgi:hypothetical protein
VLWAPITRRDSQGKAALLPKLVEQLNEVVVNQVRAAVLTSELVAVEVSEVHPATTLEV